MPLTTTRIAHIDFNPDRPTSVPHHVVCLGAEHPAIIDGPYARWLGAGLWERRVQRVASGVLDLRQPDRRDEVLSALHGADRLFRSRDQDERGGFERAYFR
jgi:hypothetical protein